MTKNFFLKTVVGFHQCLSRKKNKGCQERFLVVSTTGLGDTLWATPALRALKKHNPLAYVAVLTSPLGAEILKKNPYVDEIFVVLEPPLLSLIKLYSDLRRRFIDTVLLFHTSQRPILPFCRLLGAKDLIGTEKLNKGLDDLLTRKAPLKAEHEITRRLALLDELGICPQGQGMEIFFGEEDEYAAECFLRRFSISPHRSLVGIHPGAKDRFKQWHPEGFIALGKRLVEERDCQMIITGNLSEQALVNKIAGAIPRAVAMSGQLKVRELAALQKKMDLFVTNDTGPMHLAAAVGTPLLAIFGPTNPALCGPITSSKVELVTVLPSCAPCLKKKCGEPFCLLQIGSNDIYTKAVSLLDPP